MKAIIVCCIASLLTLYSCSLEEEIFDRPAVGTFIKSEQDVFFQLTGIYGLLSKFEAYKYNFNSIITYGGDDIAISNPNYRPFTERTVSPSNTRMVGPWAVFYQLIDNVNSLMEVVRESSALSEAFKSRIIGELHFLRGFTYFNLVRVFGGVPIRISPTNAGSDFYPKRNSDEEVYELVLADLEEASLKCLPFSQQPSAEFGRATKGAAQGMLSKAWLTYGNKQSLAGDEQKAAEAYQLAKNYADSVLLSNEYELINDYADLWDITKERNAYREVIFGIHFTRDVTVASASSKGSEYAYFYQPSTRNGVNGNITNGVGNGAMRIQPWFYDRYSTGEYENDYRTEVSFLTAWRNTLTNMSYITYPRTKTASETVEPYPYLNKYVDPDGLQARNNENDLFILRLAEIYLIKAEAENELNGPTPLAYEAFNVVRSRARQANGVARLTPTDLQPGLSKEDFRLKIFDERGLELVGEGHRWFDAVRMRYKGDTRTMIQYQYEVFLPGLTRQAPVYNAATNSWGGGRVQPLNVVPFNRKFLIWPIPSTEIDANPNISQSSQNDAWK